VALAMTVVETKGPAVAVPAVIVHLLLVSLLVGGQAQKQHFL
jgi:hypothetical protein